MRQLKWRYGFWIALLMIGTPAWAGDLDQLLEKVKVAGQQEQLENQKREQLFLEQRNQQRAVLKQLRWNYQKQSEEQRRLKRRVALNTDKIKELKAELRDKQGKLVEMTQLFRQAATDLKSLTAESLTRFNFLQRQQELEKLSLQKTRPNLQELRRIWFLLQQELIEGGQVRQFSQEVILPDGVAAKQPVTRYGVFAARSGEQYLKTSPGLNRLLLLDREPEGDWSRWSGGADGVDDVVVDPTGGELFRMISQTPTLSERIRQGKSIGYGILALGLIGVGIALVRGFILIWTRRKVGTQLKTIDMPHQDNPLGRIIQAFHEAAELPLEKMEVKLEEAVQKEISGLERGQSFIKLLAAVAPLLGLLGTVTGMISTFQSITLFGAGDPKLMAGGISQALVTTALGLVAAIPLLFGHSMLASVSRSLIGILEEQSIGLVAMFVDQKEKTVLRCGRKAACSGTSVEV